MAGWYGPLARALDSFEPWHAEVTPEADYSTLERYCNDPAYRCEVDADVARNRAIAHAAIDRGMAAVNARQAERWAREEAEGEALVARHEPGRRPRVNRDDITAAREEAQRFIDRCDAAYNAFKWRSYTNVDGGYWDNTDTRHSASLKRASMDLTRSLAALRRRGA